MSTDFETALAVAIEEKYVYCEKTVLPQILENYRGLHSCALNLLNILTKKGLITADPDRLDKKIPDIIVPDSEPFNEQERSKELGIRLSDFERILDFISNTFKLSIKTLTIDRIKKLLALNSTFLWNSLTPNNTKPNSQGLGVIIQSILQGKDGLTKNMVTDILSNASKFTSKINTSLKEVTDFQREYYKYTIRQDILPKLNLNPAVAAKNLDAVVQQIKKAIISIDRKQIVYTELIGELVNESYGPQKETSQAALFERLKTVSAQPEQKKTPKINTRAMLMDAVRIFSGLAPQLEAINYKLIENKNILASEHNSFWDKIKEAFKKAFNIPDKPIQYDLTIIDSVTQMQRHELLDFQPFVDDLNRRIHLYASFSSPDLPGYQKMLKISEQDICEFLSKHLSDCQRIMIRLTALDTYFKTTANSQNKNRIKGMKIELTAIKNTLIKSNQYKAEYTSYIEEQRQMRQLGIIHDDE